MQQLRHTFTAALYYLEHLQRADQAVARGVLVQRQQVARTFATQQPAVLFQRFQHIAVAHFGAHKLHTFFFECNFYGHVGHQRAHRAGHGFAALQALGDHQVKHFVTIEQAACGVHHLQAVGVAI